MRIMNNSFYRTSGVAALYHSWNHLHLLKGQERGSPFSQDVVILTALIELIYAAVVSMLN